MADFAAVEGKRLFSYSGEKLAYLLSEHVLFFLERAAGQESLKEYASTLVAACVEKGSRRAVLANLGDGGILAFRAGTMAVELPPQREQGFTALTPVEGSHRHMQVKQRTLMPGERLLLGTDGFFWAMTQDRRRGDVLRPMLRRGDYDGAEERMQALAPPDDCSFLLMEEAG